METYAKLVKYLDGLKDTSHSYSKDIPAGVMHSNDCDNGTYTKPMYKCRKMWFTAVMVYVERGMEYGFVPPNVARQYQDFLEYMDDTGFRMRDTREEDINRADRILASLVQSLEEMLELESN